MRKVTITSNLEGFNQKKHFFFEGWSWFKFNNLGLAGGMALKTYTSLAKVLKLKDKKAFFFIVLVKAFNTLKQFLSREYFI